MNEFSPMFVYSNNISNCPSHLSGSR